MFACVVRRSLRSRAGLHGRSGRRARASSRTGYLPPARSVCAEPLPLHHAHDRAGTSAQFDTRYRKLAPCMKTRLLWTLILAVGSTALYFGITQPEVTSIPSELRDSLDD